MTAPRPTPDAYTSLPQEVIFTNLGNVLVSPNFAGGAVSGNNFPGSQNCAGATLAPGASCQFTYRFTPQALGPASGSTSAAVDSESYSFNFKGNGISPFLATATSFDFGNVALGSESAPQVVTITNVSNANLSPNFAGGAVPGGNFPGSQNCAGKTFAPGESCQFTYRFAPQTEGPIAGATNFAIDGELTSLSFTGVGGTTNADPFLVTARSFNFGDMHVGSTSPAQIVTITNVSGDLQSPNFAGGAVPGANFPGFQNCAGKTFAPGESCQFTYQFAPEGEGAITETTNFAIDAATYTLNFQGNGIDPFLVTPLSVNFGEALIGQLSPPQFVTITNVSSASLSPNFAGGAVPGGNFPGSQNCAGKTFAPNESCQFQYAFMPTTEGVFFGTTNFAIDGKTRTLNFTGRTATISPHPSQVPLPASITLLALGILGLFGFQLKKTSSCPRYESTSLKGAVGAFRL
ncbi:choice-of-anchor D domain-containing protein [Phaeobacter sp. 22II1-1F12B]|uniref:choice-of-anchor D domain-containing protein n=1 Tax=Phaeobacter sp. 22II1-1F12B TaxID=1317111 RepID=UPI000B528EFC|nr:choice-of-anchor D domain-containing protein [Phaeobacter sp. 22II1-1F12B]